VSQRVNKTITVVLPVYNEAENVGPIASRVASLFKDFPYLSYRLLFVNDGSTDDTYMRLRKLADSDPRIQLVDLSRNFGNQNAIAAGLRYASGDAVVTMDADLQHPVEIIQELIEKWTEGAEVVLTRRTGYKKGLGHRFFFWLLSKFSDVDLESSVSDFRLLDRKVVDVLNTFTEKERFFRGIVHWVGFRREYVSYKVSERFSGKSHFTLSKLMRLGLTGFTSFSTFPLRLSLLFGIPILVGSIAGLIFMTIMVLFVNPDFSRPIAFVVVLNALLSGVILICLGAVAKYLEIVYREAMGRPSFIVRERRNIEYGSANTRDGHHSDQALEPLSH
jgi:polyisoprenyl-phosphate glycosyltransferase